MNQDDLFLKLELSDIENKLRELLFSRHPLKIWEDVNTYARVELKSVENLSLKIAKFDFYNEEKVYFVSFNLRGMNYYFRATTEELDGDVKLTPLGDIYRVERRRDVRLRMHPRVPSQLYLKIDREDEVDTGNVLSINKVDNKERALFQSFQEELRGVPEIGGVKVLDLSEKGLSAVCSSNEAKLITYSKPTSAILIVEKNNVVIEDIEVIYEVDYLDVRLEGVGMKKLGMSFSANPKLSELINNLNDESIVLSSLDEEFAKFIDQLEG
ncbi:hypothetical protein [Bacteriovorax sp. Seq25_V]|uniref:hypothetical protein n=1 Tax=Bacteriovorax sp. Seq25_V TaxID=1201288 RepID=UPI000389F876|nr:hypothetical protein [Bacteriovorax sp. Seq25_V]EQC46910.1 hypothetical protein M900_2635 [Bacteriovorax sp. Seq25_V]